MKRLLSFLIATALMLGLSGCRTYSISTVEETLAQTPVATVPPTTQTPVTEAPTAQTTQATEPPISYVEVFREGESSQIPVEIVQGTVGNYTIAMDPEYFTFSAHETVDMFSYEGWDGDQAVHYSVSDYLDDADSQGFIDSAVAQFGHQYESYSTEQTTVGAFDATAVYFSSFKESPEYQTHLFLVNCEGNYYLIEATFTFEMYEGLYAIMRALFDTMTPVSD